MTRSRPAATSFPILALTALTTLGAQDRRDDFAAQVDALATATAEERWIEIERGLWQQDLNLALALVDRLGAASGAWAPALRKVLDEEHPTTFWPALELLARVDPWATEASDAARFTVDDELTRRLASRAEARGLLPVSPTGARTRVEYAALLWNSRRSVDPGLPTADLARWLADRPSDPFAVQCVAQTLGARGGAAAEAVPGLLLALEGTLEETRIAQGLVTAQIPATVQSVVQAIRRIAPADPRSGPAWLWTLCDARAPVSAVQAARAALLAPRPAAARATAALVRCVETAGRDPQVLAAIEVLVALGADALPAVSALQDYAASQSSESPCGRAARQGAESIREAACLSWLGPNASARERTRCLRIRQQVDELLDAYLGATAAAEGDELFERLAGFGVFTSQALVDRVFRGGDAPVAISRGTPAGRLLAPLIARLGTAHAAVLPRIEAEIRRNDPLTQLWALDLYMRLGPWSGRVTPESVPALDALDLRGAQLAWEGPAIDRRVLAQRIEQQQAYVESFLNVTRQRFAIRVDGPVHGLMELLRSRSPMEVELGARALALAEPEAAATVVPLIRELRSGYWSKYEPVDALDQNFWSHADTALDELWIQLAPPSRDHEALVRRSIARADRHPLEVARICAWLETAPTTTGVGSEVPQLLLNQILQHACRFGDEERIRQALAALVARLEREPLASEVRALIASSLDAGGLPDLAVQGLEEILKKRD